MTPTIIPQLDGRTCTSCIAIQGENDRLQSELDAADRDPIWGIYTRIGVERRMPALTAEHVVVVIDLDNMHGCNAAHGHDGVDRRVTKIMALLRIGDDILIGRWKQGDEAVMFPLRDDAMGMAYRLRGALEALDMSATIAIVAGITHAAITIGLARIEAAKEANERGRIFVVEGNVA